MNPTTSRIARVLTELPLTQGIAAEEVVNHLLLVAADVGKLDLEFDPGDRLRSRTGSLRCRADQGAEELIPGVHQSVFRGILAYIATTLTRSKRDREASPYEASGRVELRSLNRAIRLDIAVVNTQAEQSLRFAQVANSHPPRPHPAKNSTVVLALPGR